MDQSDITDRNEALVGRLIAARRAAKLTQAELAKRLGKPQSFISKYERRERRLDVVEFVDICEAIGISSAEVVADLAAIRPGRVGGRA